jgi:hypothetical protein
MNDFIGLFFMLIVIGIIAMFFRHKIKNCKTIEPDSLEAALLRKNISEGKLVVNVPDTSVIGK